ncbi:MAG: 50S ribosomal protein L11 methyltransferase, partial [Acidiferrobacterales bacterium]|nr:50S ribosomal protein L11 methyltransferase [Acidiferrobacterales bacterium]
MSWSQISFVVDAAKQEALVSVLEAFLAQAVTTENAGDDEFYEVAFPGKPDWQKVSVTALFDRQVDLKPMIDFVETQFAGAEGVEIPISIQELIDQDWQRVWLDSFQPIEVGTNLWVCPSWCEPKEPSARNIVLDPGLAFGTGTHATTAMCLNWLAEQDLAEQNVLDYGSGSGILSIGALFSGAGHVDAVDIDPLAVQACEQNAERNHFSDRMTAFLPTQLPNENRYDLVIANILADIIIELQDTLLVHLASNGRLLLTGILQTQADRVVDAFGHACSFEEQSKDQWCLLIGRR